MVVSSPLPPKTAWPRLIVLFAAGVAVAFQIGKVPGALPVLTTEFGLSLFLAGWVVSIFNAISAGGGALFGATADRFGQRRVALSGMTLCAVSGIAGAFSTSQEALLASRALEGVGFLLTVVSIPPLLLAQTAAHDRAKVMGLWGAYMPVGMATLLFASGPLLEIMDWRSLWLLTSGLILAVAVVVGVMVPRHTVEKNPGQRLSFADMRRLVTTPGPVLLALTFSTYAAQFLAVMSFLPLLLVELEGFDTADAAMLGAVAVAANAIGCFLSGFLLDRGLTRATVIIATSLVMAASGLVLFLDIFGFPVRYASALLLSGAGGLIPGTLFAGTPVHAPSERQVSSVNGMLLQGAALGLLLGPPAVGFIVSTAGTWQAAPLFTVPAAGATIAFALMLGKLERGPRAEP